MTEGVPTSGAAEAHKEAKGVAKALHATSPRFGVTLAVFLSIALIQFIAELCAKSSSSVSRFIGTFIFAFAAFFAIVWMRVHSFALSRKRRAWFDEANILETYQPRARTVGHLFHPDPPTPGPTVKIAESSDNEMHTDAEKVAFNANRDVHYANMFEQAMRLNREMEAAQKIGDQSPKPVSPEPSSAPAKDASDFDNNTDLSSNNNKPGVSPPIDDNTLRGVSEIRSINLLPVIESKGKSPNKKKSETNVKSPKSPGKKVKQAKKK